MGKWKNLEAELKSEIHDVSKIMQICSSFKIDFENKAKDKNTENNNNLILRDYLDNNNNNIPKEKPKNVNSNNNVNEKKWERFGGKQPFSHMNDDPFENNFNNEIYQKRNSNKKIEDNNFVLNKKAPSEDKKEGKDPMVWDPPEDKINRNQNKAIAKPRQSNPQVKPVVKNPASNINPYKYP